MNFRLDAVGGLQLRPAAKRLKGGALDPTGG